MVEIPCKSSLWLNCPWPYGTLYRSSLAELPNRLNYVNFRYLFFNALFISFLAYPLILIVYSCLNSSCPNLILNSLLISVSLFNTELFFCAGLTLRYLLIYWNGWFVIHSMTNRLADFLLVLTPKSGSCPEDLDLMCNIRSMIRKVYLHN